jgi:hypothetical protein
VRRDRRRVLVVALGALALGILATAAFVARGPDAASARPEGTASGAADPGSLVTIKLRANVDGARFLVDGRQIAGGVLRGPRGETKKVTVEAEGYAPAEAIVTFEPGQDPPPLFLTRPSAPTASATTVAAASSSTAPERRGRLLRRSPTRPQQKQAVFRNGTLPSAKPTAAPLPPPTTATATAAPPPPAPTLTLKLD